MTFRRLKKVNSSGHGSQESDIYFLSTKSDSCRTQETNCSEVYNYKSLSKSLAYSGGTLPRSFKKVRGTLIHLNYSFNHFTLTFGGVSDSKSTSKVNLLTF